MAMFWRERERGSRDRNSGSGPPTGQVQVLVVGESGVGKTSLVHLIEKGYATVHPSQTVGCSVSVKHITYRSPASSSSSTKGDSGRDFFIELWDISGHDRYKDCRSLFYSQINGVIFVHDLSQGRTKTSLQNWVTEVAAKGTFSAPLGSGGPYGLPVPYLVIGNKADISAKDGERGSSSGNLVEAARHWVEKQGFLSTGESLPTKETFPGNSSLISAAREARYDKEALVKFFHLLIRRRYYADETPASSPWSAIPRTSDQYKDEISSDDDFYHSSASLSSNIYSYDAHPPLPAQCNLPPPPTLYPQQPVSSSEAYSLPTFAQKIIPDTRYSRLQRSDINV